MAWALLLYYKLLQEKGITNDQTVYLEPSEFDPFLLCTVEVEPEHAIEIDRQLLRESAVIHILCDLNDFITEYEDDFLSQPFVQRAMTAHKECRLSAISEAAGIFELMSAGEARFNYSSYKAILTAIFNKYVLGRFGALLREQTPNSSFKADN